MRLRKSRNYSTDSSDHSEHRLGLRLSGMAIVKAGNVSVRHWGRRVYDGCLVGQRDSSVLASTGRAFAQYGSVVMANVWVGLVSVAG